MRSRPPVRPWRLTAAAALLTAACFSLLHHGGGGDDGRGLFVSGAAAPPAANLGPANADLPAGGWKAVGRVVWMPPKVESNQPVGTVLRRPWSFRRVCARRCRIVFSRWTLYGPSVTPLVRRGRFFIASFPPVSVPCIYPEGSSYRRRNYGQSHDRYRLWWSADGTQIHAIEHRLQTGCYERPDPPDVTRWRARRA